MPPRLHNRQENRCLYISTTDKKTDASMSPQRQKNIYLHISSTVAEKRRQAVNMNWKMGEEGRDHRLDPEV
jgi:hypothetical protein